LHLINAGQAQTKVKVKIRTNLKVTKNAKDMQQQQIPSVPLSGTGGTLQQTYALYNTSNPCFSLMHIYSELAKSVTTIFIHA
jgi:hypothetical protein